MSRSARNCGETVIIFAIATPLTMKTDGHQFIQWKSNGTSAETAAAAQPSLVCDVMTGGDTSATAMKQSEQPHHLYIVTPLRGVLIKPETAALAVLLFYKSLNQSTATISVKALELVHIRWS